MKVLQVINSLATGGAEKLLVDSVAKYRAQGIDMEVLLLNGTAQPFLEVCRQKGIPVFALGKGSVYNPLHVFRLIKYLKRYDLVHVHLFPALYWVAFAHWLCRLKQPLVFTEHSTSNRRMDNWFLKQVDRFVYSRYSKVVCITTQVRDKLKAYLNWKDADLPVIENGIDLIAVQQAVAHDRAQFEIPAHSKIVIQVASFQFPKDQITVIRAMKYLPDDVHLFLAGRGPLEELLHTEAKQLGVAKRVHFLGLRMDVPRLLKTADVVVLSSKYEGLSLASIEGMASGKPFVAADVPGLATTVGGAGELFAYGDATQLAQTIQNLLDQPSHYEEVVRKCQLRAQEFDNEIMIQKHMVLYQSLL